MPHLVLLLRRADCNLKVKHITIPGGRAVRQPAYYVKGAARALSRKRRCGA